MTCFATTLYGYTDSQTRHITCKKGFPHYMVYPQAHEGRMNDEILAISLLPSHLRTK